VGTRDARIRRQEQKKTIESEGDLAAESAGSRLGGGG